MFHLLQGDLGQKNEYQVFQGTLLYDGRDLKDIIHPAEVL